MAKRKNTEEIIETIETVETNNLPVVSTMEEMLEQDQQFLNSIHTKNMYQVDIKGKLKVLQDSNDPNVEVVYKTLRDLNGEMDNLKFDPESKKGFFNKLIDKIIKSEPAKDFVARYKTSQEVVDKLVNKLDEYSDILHNENVTMKKEIKGLKMFEERLLEQKGKLLDYKSGVEERMINADDKSKALISTKTMYPLAQREADLNQLVAVVSQAQISIGAIILNNEELINSVERAKQVTVPSLAIAATLAQQLAQQKQIADAIDDLNSKTSQLMSATSTMLQQQGAQIHKQSASAMLDAKTLEESINKVSQCIQEIETFKVSAVKELQEQNARLDKILSEAKEKKEAFLLSEERRLGISKEDYSKSNIGA